MFTGIVERMGTIQEITSNGGNKSFWIESDLVSELKIDQSISHNGICLTVEDITGSLYKVTAVAETLKKTTAGEWTAGYQINLERSLLPSSRLDGHFVQGHVDTTGTCVDVEDKKGSWEMRFRFPKKKADLIIEKGSICVNGVSLTAFDVSKKEFSVAIIPYTYLHTNLQFMKMKDEVNLEFDILGKYLLRKLSLKH